MLPSDRVLYDMMVSGRAKTRTGLCWVGEMDGIGDAERPGSEHHGWRVIDMSAVEWTVVALGASLRLARNATWCNRGGVQILASCSCLPRLALMDVRF